MKRRPKTNYYLQFKCTIDNMSHFSNSNLLTLFAKQLRQILRILFVALTTFSVDHKRGQILLKMGQIEHN